MTPQTLAQGGMSSGLSALMLVGIAIGALVLGFAGLMLVRRKLMAAPAPTQPPVGGLEHLRLLRQRGQISEDEFQEARARLIKRVTAKVSPLNKPGQPSPRITPGAATLNGPSAQPTPTSLAPKPSTPSPGPQPGYSNIQSTDAPSKPTE